MLAALERLRGDNVPGNVGRFFPAPRSSMKLKDISLS